MSAATSHTEIPDEIVEKHNAAYWAAADAGMGSTDSMRAALSAIAPMLRQEGIDWAADEATKWLGSTALNARVPCEQEPTVINYKSFLKIELKRFSEHLRDVARADIEGGKG